MNHYYRHQTLCPCLSIKMLLFATNLSNDRHGQKKSRNPPSNSIIIQSILVKLKAPCLSPHTIFLVVAGILWKAISSSEPKELK